MNTIIHVENVYRCPTCCKVSTKRPRRIGYALMCDECILRKCGEKYLRNLEAAERDALAEAEREANYDRHFNASRGGY